jgi:hypothetical protein
MEHEGGAQDPAICCSSGKGAHLHPVFGPGSFPGRPFLRAHREIISGPESRPFPGEVFVEAQKERDGRRKRKGVFSVYVIIKVRNSICATEKVW